jgi:hypothetical protein
LDLLSIATIAARIKKNRPDAASPRRSDRRVRNDAARSSRRFRAQHYV